MIAEIATVISVVKGLNDAIGALKEAADMLTIYLLLWNGIAKLTKLSKM